MNGVLLVVVASVGLLVQAPAPAASTPADPLKEFLAHYAKVDQEIKTFRAQVEMVHRIPKGAYDNDPEITKPRPVPAQDMELDRRILLIYSKPQRSIFKKVTGTGLMLPAVATMPKDRWNAYNGARHLAMDLSSAHKYKNDWGNERTEWILEPTELPLFWATGTLLMGEIPFHKPPSQHTWTNLGFNAQGHHVFSCTLAPPVQYVLTTLGPPHWRILRCDVLGAGKLIMSSRMSAWARTAAGMEYPIAWTYTFLMRDKIYEVFDCKVSLFSPNEEHPPEVFAPDFSANIHERRFRDGKTQFIPPWRWRPWHFVLIGVVPVILGAGLLYLWWRRRSMKKAVSLGLTLWAFVLCTACDLGCKEVGYLCTGNNGVSDTGWSYEEACCILHPIWVPVGTAKTNECEQQKDSWGVPIPNQRRPLWNATCFCPGFNFPREASGGTVGTWQSWTLHLCTKAPAGGGL